MRHHQTPNRRDFLRASGLAVAVGALAACQQSSPNDGSVGSPGGAANASMRMSWWGADDRHEKTLALLDLYEQNHPEVQFTPNYGGFVGYQDKAVTELSGGGGPDVMQIADRLPLIANGSLLQLDPFIESGAIDLSDANSNTVALQQFEGDQYTLPWGLATGVMFYDRKVFDAVGLGAPPNAWTWDEYRETAKAITEATPEGVYGSADIWAPAGTRAWAPFISFLLSRGIQPYTPDGQINFTPEILTEWFTFWQGMLEDGYVPPPSVTAQEAGFETSPLVTKVAAIYPINSSIASSLQGLTENPLGLTTLPTGLDSVTHLPAEEFGQYINASITIGGNANTEFAEQVADFINFTLNDPEANKITLMSRGVPLSKSMAELVEPLVTPIEREMSEVVTFVQDNAAPEVVTFPTADGEMTTLMQNSHQAIAFGQADIQSTVDQFFTQAARLLGA